MPATNEEILDSLLATVRQPNHPTKPILLELLNKELSKRARDCAEKHKRLFASSNFVNGFIKISPEDAQELIDDITHINEDKNTCHLKLLCSKPNKNK